MKRKLILLSIVTVIVLILVAPAQAIFCSKCGTNNPDGSVYCIKCGNKLENIEKSVYEQGCDLYNQEKYDQAISLLVPYCVSNSNDIESQLLLAKAYLEKSSLLKQEGSESYKFLVVKSYEIGKRILIARDQYLPEALYICGRSFDINNRATRATRYLKKAIKLSMLPPPEYFIALGDSLFSQAKLEQTQDNFESSYYLAAKKTYEDVLNMKISNNGKGKVYYKLGVLHLYFNNKKEAKHAFESALKFAERDSLISKIHNKIESL